LDQNHFLLCLFGQGKVLQIFGNWFEPIWLLYAKVTIENQKKKKKEKKGKKGRGVRFGPRPKPAHGPTSFFLNWYPPSLPFC
jgi:hypothetical protein